MRRLCETKCDHHIMMAEVLLDWVSIGPLVASMATRHQDRSMALSSTTHGVEVHKGPRVMEEEVPPLSPAVSPVLVQDDWTPRIDKEVHGTRGHHVVA